MDLDVGGQRIRRGDRVLLLWGSANRDPATFGDPDAFDPDRANLRSTLSFGFGPHHCPGTALARMEAQTAVRSLLSAVGPIALSGTPHCKSSFSFRGPAVLAAAAGERARSPAATE